MFHIITKDDYYYSNNKGIWHNNQLILKINDHFDDEPAFSVIEAKYIAIQNSNTIDIVDIFTKKKITDINSELEQIDKIVSNVDGNFIAFSGLKRGEHNEYSQGILNLYKKDKKKFLLYGVYKISGLYNNVLALDKKGNFIIFWASGKESFSDGKIYKYDILNKTEKILIDNFFINDYFKYICGTQYAIVTKEGKVFIYDIFKEKIIFEKVHFLETEHYVIIDIKFENNVFYVMLSDKIYTYDIRKKKINIIKEINILQEPFIADGGFSKKDDYAIFLCENDDRINTLPLVT